MESQSVLTSPLNLFLSPTLFHLQHTKARIQFNFCQTQLSITGSPAEENNEQKTQ